MSKATLSDKNDSPHKIADVGEYYSGKKKSLIRRLDHRINRFFRAHFPIWSNRFHFTYLSIRLCWSNVLKLQGERPSFNLVVWMPFLLKKRL